LIAAVVLAAGRGTRFGGQKLLLPLRGAPLLRRTVENVLAAGVAPLVVVMGPDLRPAIEGLPVQAVEIESESMSASLRAGLRALPEVEGAFVCLGDQPGIAPETFRRLIESFRASGRPIAAPVYRGTRGNPVLFSRALFDELCALGGDQGARGLLAARPADIVAVEIDAEMPLDVDTPGDYEALLR